MFSGGGFGRGGGWGGRGNPYPFCRFYPWLPRRWWAYPQYAGYGAGGYPVGSYAYGPPGYWPRPAAPGVWGGYMPPVTGWW